jgi:hypothetical protein
MDRQKFLSKKALFLLNFMVLAAETEAERVEEETEAEGVETEAEAEGEMQGKKW